MPTLQELVNFLYNWQMLITGLLVLGAAHVWARATIKAASTYAERAALRAMKFGPWPSTSAAGGRIEPAAAAAPSPKPPGPAAVVERYRDRIRTTLVRIPYTEDPLTNIQLEICRPVSEFPDSLGTLSSPAAQARSDRLREELKALGQVKEGESCRRLWEALVRVNAAARELAETLSREHDSLLAAE